MNEHTSVIDWEDFEKNMVMQWYNVCKIMSTTFDKYFPYFTFRGIVDCIGEDPNFKSGDD